MCDLEPFSKIQSHIILTGGGCKHFKLRSYRVLHKQQSFEGERFCSLATMDIIRKSKCKKSFHILIKARWYSTIHCVVNI